MALKFSHILFIVLCLSLFFLLRRVSTAAPSLHHRRRYPSASSSVNHRKVLSHNFDFTPFQRRRGGRPRNGSSVKPRGSGGEAEEDDGGEIDPRYGVDKRRVPTGPNPLHH
ncbi:PREDICTED: CLAVATA3/ESR (CLE)-related protein 12 [Tarenaya hassleriana]|uniref:CLAVATA3/ESR (CLE)-related protein 12 n=1 Tax=Tarenaya hassleriana TaxID=28532 RepID=UPI00053C654B|nr:PREDICTED: CLAVATA3/ESR (CLE)-related protein 12 [Tarenaya hassleriana]